MAEKPLFEQSASAQCLGQKSAGGGFTHPGTITYPSSCGHGVESISGVNLRIIEKSCPLLAEAFEQTRSGPRLHLDNLCHTTARPFVRFLHTGSYSISESDVDIYADVPSSLLLHLRLYHLGVIYELNKLKEQASVNVIRQCEFACSSPDKPIHLVKGIRYAYEHLRDETGLLNTVVSYCVYRFTVLEHDAEFRELAYDLLPFSQDLCRETMSRGFEDESAPAIIRMPFQNNAPAEYASRLDISVDRASDVIFHFHGLDENHTSPKKRKRLELTSGVAECRGVDSGFWKAQNKEERKSNPPTRYPDRAPSAQSSTVSGLRCNPRVMGEQQRPDRTSLDTRDEDATDFGMPIRGKHSSTTPEVMQVARAMDHKFEDYGCRLDLTSWSAKTQSARIEVKAAAAYSNASSGPLFRFGDENSREGTPETELSKLFKMNFEDQGFEAADDGFPYFQVAVGNVAQAEPANKQSLRRSNQQSGSSQARWGLKTAERTNATEDLCVDLVSGLAEQRSNYSSEDEDFLLMPTKDRRAGGLISALEKIKERRRRKTTREDAEYEVVAGPESVLALESSHDSDPEPFELVERPKRPILTVQNPDIEASEMPKSLLADSSDGSPDSEWSVL